MYTVCACVCTWDHAFVSVCDVGARVCVGICAHVCAWECLPKTGIRCLWPSLCTVSIQSVSPPDPGLLCNAVSLLACSADRLWKTQACWACSSLPHTHPEFLWVLGMWIPARPCLLSHLPNPSLLILRYKVLLSCPG